MSPIEAECRPISDHQLRAIAGHHGFAIEADAAQPWTGATSCVYPLGADAVLKVSHDNAGAEQSLRIDVAVGSTMREAGVRTSRLIAFDDSARLLSGPYALYARISGLPLSSAGITAEDAVHAWQELGRDQAVVHEHVARHPGLDGLRSFDQSPDVDPRPWLDDLTATGCLSVAESDRLKIILDQLAPVAFHPVRKRLCHGDVNAANILVASDTSRYLAIIDWAGAGWLDPAWDLAGIPLVAVPHVLRGHRQVAPFEGDETAEARALWCHTQYALHQLRSRSSAEAASLRSDAVRLIATVEAFLQVVGLDQF